MPLRSPPLLLRTTEGFTGCDEEKGEEAEAEAEAEAQENSLQDVLPSIEPPLHQRGPYVVQSIGNTAVSPDTRTAWVNLTELMRVVTPTASKSYQTLMQTEMRKWKTRSEGANSYFSRVSRWVPYQAAKSVCEAYKLDEALAPLLNLGAILLILLVSRKAWSYHSSLKICGFSDTGG